MYRVVVDVGKKMKTIFFYTFYIFIDFKIFRKARSLTSVDSCDALAFSISDCSFCIARCNLAWLVIEGRSGAFLHREWTQFI